MIHFTHFQTFPKIPEKVQKSPFRAVAQNEAEEAMSPPSETNLLRFLLVLCINFQLLERRQWLTTSLTGPSRTRFFTAVLKGTKSLKVRELLIGSGVSAPMVGLRLGARGKT